VLASVVQVSMLQLLHAAVHIDVTVDQQHKFILQELVCVHESVLIAQPLAAHMLHNLVPTPETSEIVWLLGDEVDVADKGVANIEN
jgi:hypothetical protein